MSKSPTICSKCFCPISSASSASSSSSSSPTMMSDDSLVSCNCKIRIPTPTQTQTQTQLATSISSLSLSSISSNESISSYDLFLAKREFQKQQEQLHSVPSLLQMTVKSFTNYYLSDKSAITCGHNLKLLPGELLFKIASYIYEGLSILTTQPSHTVHLKIKLVRQDRLQTLSVNLRWTVYECIRHIYERSAEGEGGVELQNYGLFQPAGPFRNARWLKDQNFLGDYDVKPYDMIEFKMKQSLLKVKFLGAWEKVVHPLRLSTLFDKTFKSFVVEEDKNVAQLAQYVANKLGIHPSSSYSLKCISDHEVSNTYSTSNVNPTKSKHDKFLGDSKKEKEEEKEDSVWLIPNLTLPEQGVDTLYCILQLKRLFYFQKDTITEDIPSDLVHFRFCQCLDAVIGETHPCTEEQAAEFAALQIQISFSDCKECKDLPVPKERLSEFIPAEYAQSKNIYKLVLANYRLLGNLSETDAKRRFVQLTKSLNSYGHTFFKVRQRIMSLQELVPVLLGISDERIIIMDPFTKNIVTRYPITTIRKWQVHDNALTVHLPDAKYIYLSKEAEVISQVLTGSVNENLKNDPEKLRRWNREYHLVSRVLDHSSLYSKYRCSMDSLCSFDSDFSGPSGSFKANKCRLYVAPKKVYFNPTFHEGILDEWPSEAMRRRQLMKAIKMMVDLHRKVGKCKRTGIRKSSDRSSDRGDTFEQEIIVKFMDKKEMTFIVDVSKSVRDIVFEIGGRLGIKNLDEFSLKIRHQSASVGSVWLLPFESLKNQGASNSLLLFERKFHYNDTSDSLKNDPVCFNMMFCEVRDAFISNMYSCDLEEGVQLAATLFQINFGDHNSNIHKPGFLKFEDVRFFMPVECIHQYGISFVKLEKMIYKEHQKLRGIKEAFAKFRFVLLCRASTFYGTTFFSVTQTGIGNPAKKLLLGFSRISILAVSEKGKNVLGEYPIGWLKKWYFQRETGSGPAGILTLDFGGYEEGKFSVYSKSAEYISEYLSDFIDFITTKEIYKLLKCESSQQ